MDVARSNFRHEQEREYKSQETPNSEKVNPEIEGVGNYENLKG